MIKTKVDFSKRNLAQVGIKKVTLLGQELKFVTKVGEVIEEYGKVTISHAIKTGIIPCAVSGDNNKLEMVQVYRDIDAQENIEVIAIADVYEIVRVTTDMTNEIAAPKGDVIEIDVGDFDYYTYIKDDIEELEDEIVELNKKIESLEKVVASNVAKTINLEDLLVKVDSNIDRIKKTLNRV
ncbi:MAG: hypothetical protein ACRDD7_07690 [Peptostreptococcaceae bacterium]